MLRTLRVTSPAKRLSLFIFEQVADDRYKDNRGDFFNEQQLRELATELEEAGNDVRWEDDDGA